MDSAVPSPCTAEQASSPFPDPLTAQAENTPSRFEYTSAFLLLRHFPGLPARLAGLEKLEAGAAEIKPAFTSEEFVVWQSLRPLKASLSLALFSIAGAVANAETASTTPTEQPPPAATEVWSPIPPVVAAPAGQAPADAIMLFDGRGLDAWESAKKPGQPAPWRMEDGTLTCVPQAGDIRTKAAFGDLQLHLEFRFASGITGEGQRRGNSGVFFMGLYELQVLDSYSNPTYVNGQVASVYKQHPPLVNAARPPGEWQTYDAVWTAPRFAADGSIAGPARLTLFHNGVLVQNNVVLRGPTVFRGTPVYRAHAARLPLQLQEHKNDAKDAVTYRNIWVRELPSPATP